MKYTRENLIEVIEASQFYFCKPLANIDATADKFIECYANGKNLPWKSTPPAWLEDEVIEILENLK